jgi:hypothetical protein
MVFRRREGDRLRMAAPIAGDEEDREVLARAGL